MKTKIIISILLLICSQSISATLTVSRNTVLTIGKSTQVRFNNMDINNGGEIIGDTASLIIISSNRETKIAGQDFGLFSLRIAGDVASGVRILSLSGDLVMLSGVMNIGTNRLIIGGSLLGENEQTYVTASVGIIETPLGFVPAGREISALGFDFTLVNDVHDLTIYRSHVPVWRTTIAESYKSAYRAFTFSQKIDLIGVRKQVLPHEIAHIDRQRLFVENFEGWQKVVTPNDVFHNVTQVAKFAPDDLHFPKIVTPNRATNSVFFITGLEEYPSSRLIILNRRGQILYDIYPYKNDFDGKNLPNDTYYYMFSEQRNSSPIKKSFFELIR
jgi:gliding motility-associated-like protein